MRCLIWHSKSGLRRKIGIGTGNGTGTIKGIGSKSVPCGQGVGRDEDADEMGRLDLAVSDEEDTRDGKKALNGRDVLLELDSAR